MNSLLGKKWTILLLQALHNKKIGFNQLSRIIGDITKRMLAKRLEELEKFEVIRKKRLCNKPLRVEYSLTKKGIDLLNAFNTLKNWGIKYELVPEVCIKTNCNECEHKC